MHKSISSAQEQAIRERLQSEAAAIRPAYSKAFHQRLVSAIEQQRLEDAPTRRVSTALRVRLRQAAVLAAACALGALFITRQFSEHANVSVEPTVNSIAQSPVSPTSAADLKKIGDLTERAEDNFHGLLAAATKVPQSAELKHDTRLVAQMLLRRLPVDVDVFAGSDDVQDRRETSF